VTVIDKTNYVTKAPVVRARSPALQLTERVKPILIKRPKPNVAKCRKGEKIWRTLKNGHRKYRLRRTC